MKLAVVLVHYHTPELLRGALDALERDAKESGLDLEPLVIDNGSRPEDRDLLSSLPAPRLDPGRNLGYAGGANLGVRETSAEHLVVMNPDVEVLPGCLGALVEALDDGAAAAGARFYWDYAREFLLPPTEPVSRWSELLAVLAPRSERWAGRARRRWRRHARRQWTASAPMTSHDLSGALLAFRRSAWDRVGPFDEGYLLYFEETEWLLRLREARLEARFVPAAEGVHFYARSTAGERRSEQWFLESNRRFRRRAYGAGFTRFLEWLSRAATPGSPDRAMPGDGRPVWLEVSPSPLGYPAAGRRLPSSVESPYELPEEIWGPLAPGTYFLRLVDEAGRELGLRMVEKSDFSGR